jgi:hypothetical protein
MLTGRAVIAIHKPKNIEEMKDAIKGKNIWISLMGFFIQIT